MSVVCYCDTCQRGAHALQALPNAARVADIDEGTPYVAYRKDRVSCTRGEQYLRSIDVDRGATRRVYAACCNSAMFIRFDDARHWVSLYRARFGVDAPPLDFRICAKYAPHPAAIPRDVPVSNMYPAAMMLKLLTSKIDMLLRRG